MLFYVILICYINNNIKVYDHYLDNSIGRYTKNVLNIIVFTIKYVIIFNG